MLIGTLDVTTPPGTLPALARAVASGALGPGRAARLDGDAVVFTGGRLVVERDRVRYQLDVPVRWVRAVLLGAWLGVSVTLAFSWFYLEALGVGGAAMIACAAATAWEDRRRARQQVRALVGSLSALTAT